MGNLELLASTLLGILLTIELSESSVQFVKFFESSTPEEDGERGRGGEGEGGGGGGGEMEEREC